MKIHPTESAVVLLLAVVVDYSSPNSVLQFMLINYLVSFQISSVICDMLSYTLVQTPSSGNVLELKYGHGFKDWSIISMCGQ